MSVPGDDDEIVFDRTSLLDNTEKSAPRNRWCRKFTKTIALSAAFCSLGLCIAVPGPTLIDLQQRVNTDTEHISYIFTARSIGYLLGSVLGGLLFDRFDQQLLLCFMLFFTGIATAAAPWCATLVVLAVMISFQGVSMGILDTGGNVYCIQIWGKSSGPYMQMLHFFFGAGAFIAPLLAKPFLSPDLLGLVNGTQLSLGQVPGRLSITIPHFKTTFESDLSSRERRFIRIPRQTDIEDIKTSTSTGKMTPKPKPKKPKALLAEHLPPDSVADGGNLEDLDETKSKETLTNDFDSQTQSKTTKPNVTITTRLKSDSIVTPTKQVLSTTNTTPPTKPTTVTVAPPTKPTTVTVAPPTIPTTVTVAPPTIPTTVIVAPPTTTTLNSENSSDAGSNSTDYHKPNTTGDAIKNALDAVKNMSRIQFVYMIIGIFLFVISVLFLVMYCFDKHSKYQVKQETDEERSTGKSESFGFRVQLLILLFIFFFIDVGMEVTYGGLLMTFAVDYLHWTKDRGAIITSIFWGSLAAGCSLGIFIAKCLKPSWMLSINIVLVLGGALMLTFGIKHYPVFIWIGTILFGGGMSTVFPTGILWAEHYLKLTGRATAVFVVGSALGEMVVPVVTGYFFDTKDNMALMYIMCAMSIASVIVFIIMQNLASNSKRTTKSKAHLKRSHNGDLEMDFAIGSQSGFRKRQVLNSNRGAVEYSRLHDGE